MTDRGTGRARPGKATRRAVAIVLLSFGALAGGMAKADGGRDFAGEFAIVSQDPVDAQNTLVTVRLRVQNVSGHDITGATVELVADPMIVEGPTFPTQLTLANRDMAVVEGSFSVPAEHTTRWIEAGGPAFRVTYTDASGNTWQRPVEAIHVPFVMEAQP